MDDKTQRRILLVDDEANQRRAIGRVLMDLNADIIESENGKAALETARTFRPDLVILDILMPEMDGYEVCRRIKGDPETAVIMILILSARPLVRDRLMGYDAGADDYLKKPFDPEELKAKCRILCRLKEARDQVAESEEKFRGIASSATDAVIMLDGHGMVSFWNRSAERIFGFERGEIMGKDLHRLVLKSDDYRLFKEGFAIFGNTGKGPIIGGTREVTALRKGGMEFPAELSISALKLQGRWCAVGIVRDVTERKDAEREIHEARQAADAANNAKGEFLANMSHEIRTPMNAIIGMTDLALDTSLDKMQRDYLETVRDSADGLLRLLNDILDFSKIESKKVEIEAVDFDIRESLGGFLRPLAIGAHGKGLELAYHVNNAVPERVLGDPARLRQIVVNLVGNAIKFTERGEVVVRVDRKAVKDGNVRLHFSVSDTGIGIPRDRQSRIFEPFTQADASITGRYGGTGLGLVISRALAELMGGRMWVESEPGSGTIFHFEALFAFSSPSRAPALPNCAVPLKGLSVLIADGNATSCRILTEILQGWGMHSITVSGAEDALRHLRDAENRGEPFSFVLADGDLPGADSNGLVSRIREKHGPDLRIILMLKASSHRAIQVAQDITGEGPAVACIHKPVRPSNLMDVLMDTLPSKARRDSTPVCRQTPEATRKKDAHGPPQEKKSLRILLAEDNAVNRKLALLMLKKEGHGAVSVENGKEALQALQKNVFDLVLMDVQMPVMDGVEATRRIRTMEEKTGGHVPIVALTANAMKGDRERYLAAGMDDYMAKPFKVELLVKVIERNIMKEKRG